MGAIKESVGEVAHRGDDHPWVRHAARAGMAAYGVVNLLIGWLALQLALGDQSGKADSSGALHELAKQPLGAALVWAVAVGMLLLVLGEGWLVYASFVFLGFGFSGWMMAAVTLVLEFGEHEDIPMRLALTTTVEGGVSSVGPILVGLSIAALGYAPLIVAAFASLLASLALMLWRVREPRTSA